MSIRQNGFPHGMPTAHQKRSMRICSPFINICKANADIL